jgi:diguanylate cyclase (GGDEF)-like protein/PAS domain S-box-containing protein
MQKIGSVGADHVTPTQRVEISQEDVPHLRTLARGRWRPKLWGVLVLVNVAFLGFSLANLSDSRTRYEHQAGVDARNMAAALKEGVKGGISATEISLRSLTTDPWTRDIILQGTTQSKAQALEAFAQKDETARSFQFFDEFGKLQAISGAENDAPMDISQGEVFGRLRSQGGDQVAISKPLLSTRSKEWSIILARRILGNQGHFRGVVSARIPLTHFYGLFAPLSLGRLGAVSIRDLDNTIVARFPQVTPLSQDANKISEVMRSALSRDPWSGTFVTASQYDGIHRTVSYERVGKFPLNVFVATASADYLEPWFAERRKTYVQIALFLFVTSFLMWLVAIAIRKHEVSAMQVLQHEGEIRGLLESAPDALLVLDQNGVVQSANREAGMLLRTRPGTLRGLPVERLLSRHQLRVHPTAVQTISAGTSSVTNTARRHITIRRQDGTKLPLAVSARRVAPGNGNLVVLDIRDLTEHRAARAKMTFLADHDALTGLPNRQKAKTLVETILEKSRRSQTAIALVHIGLDRFKSINDSASYEGGDHVLAAVAKRLNARRPRPEVAARLSGDEFLLVFTAESYGCGVEHMLEQLLVDIRIPVNINKCPLAVTASAGVSLFPRDGDTYQALAQKANFALQRAKAVGRDNFTFFDEQSNAELQAKHALGLRLRRGLWERELSLHYQPIIDLESGRVVSVEALLRWYDSELGQISPALFIPVAEETGLIVDIGNWVLDEACRQFANWQNAGLAVPIAVNLSAVQFQRSDVEDIIEEALAKHAVAPQALQLELTESILLQDTEQVLACLQRLQSKGIEISIDDFGTGYSSLSYLRRLNADKVKIDQSFVRELAGAKGDVAIVQAIIQMAHSLGLVVVAEGVETEEILEVLRGLGCDLAQGYLFARPAPASALNFELYVGTNSEEARDTTRSTLS